ncbi:MAG: SDR family oxidoreductase [Acidimicrobiales bacterium]
MPVAIVTGASRGFGRALATDLADSGWGLVIDGRNAGSLGAVAERLQALGGPVRPVVGDVVDPDHRARLVAEATGLGGLDLLVNNASELGPSPLPTLEQFPLDALRTVYEVNVVAPLALLQLALPLLRRSGGVVVSLSSDAAVEAYEGWGGYGSSKAAVDQLHRVLAVEEPKLQIYQFDPGDMRTDMHQAAFPGEDISDRPEPESVVPALRRLLRSGAPSGRYRAADGVRS